LKEGGSKPVRMIEKKQKREIGNGILRGREGVERNAFDQVRKRGKRIIPLGEGLWGGGAY